MATMPEMKFMVNASGLPPETPSSVEITKTTKGHTWSVKVYCEAGEEAAAKERALQLDHELSEYFAGEWVP